MSSEASSPLPDSSPSNPAVLAAQSQWIFTDDELQRAPSILDGMSIETERNNRRKGVNFITHVGILLKLPQLTLCTASVYMHRFFMRHSMVDLPQRPGMHPYSVGATALFLATKVEENCRKMKEMIVACCRVAQKQPNLLVDEQSKEFWKWRDTILHNEDTLLESLCFDLQLDQPYRILYEIFCQFEVQDNKRMRNSAWAFINDSTYTVLCLQFPARTIAAAAFYAAAKHCKVSFEDDNLERPWWQQLGIELKELKRACNLMAAMYDKQTPAKSGESYTAISIGDDDDSATDSTRRSKSLPADDAVNGTDKKRTDYSNGGEKTPIATPTQTSSLPTSVERPQSEDSERSPKRQRLGDSLGESRRNGNNNNSTTAPRSRSHTPTPAPSQYAPSSRTSQSSFAAAVSNLNLATPVFTQQETASPSALEPTPPGPNEPQPQPRADAGTAEAAVTTATATRNSRVPEAYYHRQQQQQKQQRPPVEHSAPGAPPLSNGIPRAQIESNSSGTHGNAQSQSQSHPPQTGAVHPDS